MKLRVIGLLLLVPLVDVLLLVVLATGLGPITIGPAATVALVVLTALLGLLIVRAEGRHTIRKIQRKLAKGEPPTDELLDGALLLIAGTLMLTPGIITDLIGLLLALPPTRYPIRIVVKRYVVTPILDGKTGGFATGNVYIGGFPSGDGGEGGFDGGFSGGPQSGPRGGKTVEMDADDYGFEDVDESDEFTDVGDFGTPSDSDDDGDSRDR